MPKVSGVGDAIVQNRMHEISYFLPKKYFPNLGNPAAIDTLSASGTVASGNHHRVGGQDSMNQLLQAAQTGSRAARLRCEFSIGQSIGHVIVWVVLTLVTFGLALLVFPYYLNRAVLNRTEVLDQSGRAIGKLRCNFDLISSIGHVIIWGILILITFGIAGFFYLYRVVRVVLSDTVIEYY